MKNMKKYKNGNLQKLIILEGFMQNGYYHRNQRIFLRMKSSANFFFDISFETNNMFEIKMLNFYIRIIKNYMI